MGVLEDSPSGFTSTTPYRGSSLVLRVHDAAFIARQGVWLRRFGISAIITGIIWLWMGPDGNFPRQLTPFFAIVCALAFISSLGMVAIFLSRLLRQRVRIRSHSRYVAFRMGLGTLMIAWHGILAMCAVLMFFSAYASVQIGPEGGWYYEREQGMLSQTTHTFYRGGFLFMSREGIETGEDRLSGIPRGDGN